MGDAPGPHTYSIAGPRWATANHTRRPVAVRGSAWSRVNWACVYVCERVNVRVYVSSAPILRSTFFQLLRLGVSSDALSRSFHRARLSATEFIYIFFYLPEFDRYLFSDALYSAHAAWAGPSRST